MSQSGVVDAHVYTTVLGFDGSEHGQNLLLVAQVTFEWDQNTAVAQVLALSGQFLGWNTCKAQD